jgi:hypothetical protein
MLFHNRVVLTVPFQLRQPHHHRMHTTITVAIMLHVSAVPAFPHALTIIVLETSSLLASDIVFAHTNHCRTNSGAWRGIRTPSGPEGLPLYRRTQPTVSAFHAWRSRQESNPLVPGSPTLTGFQDQRPTVEHLLRNGGSCQIRTDGACYGHTALAVLRFSPLSQRSILGADGRPRTDTPEGTGF